MKQIFRFLTLAPSITFGLIRAEVFPWALIFAFFWTKKFSLSLLFFLFIILFNSFIFSLYYYSDDFSEVARSVFAYLNPLLIFFYLLRADFDEIEKYSKLIVFVFVFYTFIAIIQVSGLASLVGMNYLVSYLVPRSVGDLSEGFRGVSILSSEPSRAAIEYIFIYLASFSFSKYIQSRKIFFDFFVLFFLALILRSATGVFVFLLYFFICYLKFNKKFIFIFLASIVLFVFVSNVQSDSRALILLGQLVDSSGYRELFDLFWQSSGFRLISVLSAYFFGISSVFGGGVGFWEISSIDALRSLGVDADSINFFQLRGGDFFAIRPTAYFASLFLDLGLVALVAVYIFFRTSMPLFKSSSRDGKIVFIIFVFTLFFISVIGNPVPWICTVLILRNFNKDFKCS